MHNTEHYKFKKQRKCFFLKKAKKTFVPKVLPIRRELAKASLSANFIIPSHKEFRQCLLPLKQLSLLIGNPYDRIIQRCAAGTRQAVWCVTPHYAPMSLYVGLMG